MPRERIAEGRRSEHDRSCPSDGHEWHGSPPRAARCGAEDAGIEAVLIGEPANRTYLSGFTGSAGWLLITQDAALIAADLTLLGSELAWNVLALNWSSSAWAGAASPAMVCRACWSGSGAHQVAFEADHVPYAEAQAWMDKNPQVEWVATQGLVRQIALGQRCGGDRYAARGGGTGRRGVGGSVLAQVRAGMTERELAWLIESYMRTHGAEASPSTPSSGSGRTARSPTTKPAKLPWSRASRS